MATEFNEFPHRLFLERPHMPLPTTTIEPGRPAPTKEFEPSEKVKNKLTEILLKVAELKTPQEADDVPPAEIDIQE